MQKLFSCAVASLLLLSTVGCGSGVSTLEPSTNVPSVPKGEVPSPRGTVSSPSRFRLNGKEIDEPAFNRAIEKELARFSIRYSFEVMSIRQLRFNADRTWSPSGDSVELTVSGEVCKEGQLTLHVRAYQNDFAKMLTLAAGFKIPYRLGQKRSMLELPTQYENQMSVFARGFPKLEVVDPSMALSGLIAAENRGADLYFDATISNRNIDFTLMKSLGISQYVLIAASYAPFGCGTL